MWCICLHCGGPTRNDWICHFVNQSLGSGLKLWNTSLFWLTKLTSAASDVANIDLGAYSDALMIKKQSRTHLVTISCASHWLEFLLKGCSQGPLAIFPLFKYSGKLKTEVRICCLSNLYFLLSFVANIWHRNIFKSQIQTFCLSVAW